ncbi:MAG: hypothetical protein QE285_05560 [Aquabacterium sp.]|nr:hypothetical protein [Aquabacterium sp.]
MAGQFCRGSAITLSCPAGMMERLRSSAVTEFATMMQIVPVGSDARRAAALAQFFAPVLRLLGLLGLLWRRANV